MAYNIQMVIYNLLNIINSNNDDTMNVHRRQAMSHSLRCSSLHESLTESKHYWFLPSRSDPLGRITHFNMGTGGSVSAKCNHSFQHGSGCKRIFGSKEVERKGLQEMLELKQWLLLPLRFPDRIGTREQHQKVPRPIPDGWMPPPL